MPHLNNSICNALFFDIHSCSLRFSTAENYDVQRPEKIKKVPEML